MEEENDYFPLTRYNPPLVSNPTFSLPESPETAICRREPYFGSEALERICKDKTASLANCQGYEVADAFLRKISPSKLEKISGVNVSVKREKGSGILTLFGKKERITLDIDLEFL